MKAIRILTPINALFYPAAAYEVARNAVRADEAQPDAVFHPQNLGHGLNSIVRFGLFSARRISGLDPTPFEDVSAGIL